MPRDKCNTGVRLADDVEIKPVFQIWLDVWEMVTKVVAVHGILRPKSQSLMESSILKPFFSRTKGHPMSMCVLDSKPLYVEDRQIQDASVRLEFHLRVLPHLFHSLPLRGHPDLYLHLLIAGIAQRSIQSGT